MYAKFSSSAHRLGGDARADSDVDYLVLVRGEVSSEVNDFLDDEAGEQFLFTKGASFRHLP